MEGEEGWRPPVESRLPLSVREADELQEIKQERDSSKHRAIQQVRFSMGALVMENQWPPGTRLAHRKAVSREQAGYQSGD